MHIKKGDNVVVIAGGDKGKEGKVLQVFRNDGYAVVEGLNVKKRHSKPRRSGTKGQILSIPHPIHISNLAIAGAPKKAPAKKAGKPRAKKSE